MALNHKWLELLYGVAMGQGTRATNVSLNELCFIPPTCIGPAQAMISQGATVFLACIRQLWPEQIKAEARRLVDIL